MREKSLARDPRHPQAMTVMELINDLTALPQNLPVFYLGSPFSRKQVTLSVYEDDKCAWIDIGPEG